MSLSRNERQIHIKNVRALVAKAEAMDDANSPGGAEVTVSEVIDLVINGVGAVIALAKDIRDNVG